MELIGRNKEIKELDAIMESGVPEFAVIYGRPRVGKTYLANQYFKDKFTFKFTGLAKKSKKEQLHAFWTELNKQGSINYQQPATWYEAFEMLRSLIENSKKRGRKIVFIDELPFMDTPRSSLITALEHFWNHWGCTREDLALIVCGSATSWITKNIIRNHGGLHNRLTRKIYIKPFNLAECKTYLKKHNFHFTDKEITECYMIMGGIPFYLSLLDNSKSLAQNIDELFFRRKGKLSTEFDDLYASLFSKSKDYIAVIEALSKKSKGLTRKEIIEATHLANSGDLTRILDDLDNCDLIRRYRGYGKTERMNLYQLTDFYSFFYFKFIKEHNNTDNDFWIHQINTPAHNAWSGYAFEQLCLYHEAQIEHALGISGVLTECFSWTSNRKNDDCDNIKKKNAQIDLIIKRADNVVNICEMKYCAEKFIIKKSYWDNLENKISAFRLENNYNGNIQLVMVTTFGLLKNKYSQQVLHQITMEQLFNNI